MTKKFQMLSVRGLHKYIRTSVAIIMHSYLLVVGVAVSNDTVNDSEVSDVVCMSSSINTSKQV